MRRFFRVLSPLRPGCPGFAEASWQWPLQALFSLAACLLLFAATAAAQFKQPIAKANGTAPGCITINWLGSDPSGVYRFEVWREGLTAPLRVSVPSNLEPWEHPDCNLQPGTQYRYQVCAVYATEEEDRECVEVIGETLPPAASSTSAPPPSPVIVSHDAGLTWIGIKWEANYTYDSYFININENIEPGLPRNTRTIHHDDDGSWGYQRLEGLAPGRTYYFEVQGCSKSLAGLLEDNCRGWSQVYGAATLDPRLCISGYVWREAVPGDLVCVLPEERDIHIPNDNAQHSARSQLRFVPDGCPLINHKARSCRVLECIAPFVWRFVTPADKVCVPPERAAQVAADNAAAASRQIGNQPQP